MTAGPSPGYGTPNWELIGRWMALDPADDGPFWALNLMQYRAVAQYVDGAAPGTGSVSGREADDAYAPLGPLAAIGAEVAFVGDVVEQTSGEPAWDRVGIVRYPSRAAFFAMQQRDDFKAKHVHKEAGMAFTIVMACLPVAHDDETAAGGALVLVVEPEGEAPLAPDRLIADTTEVATLTVEGVIVGDERSFQRARFVRAGGDAAVAALVAAASKAGEAHVLVLEPTIDRLVDSIVTAPGAAAQ